MPGEGKWISSTTAAGSFDTSCLAVNTCKLFRTHSFIMVDRNRPFLKLNCLYSAEFRMTRASEPSKFISPHSQLEEISFGSQMKYTIAFLLPLCISAEPHSMDAWGFISRFISLFSDLGKMAKVPGRCRDQIAGHLARTNCVARGESYGGNSRPISLPLAVGYYSARVATTLTCSIMRLESFAGVCDSNWRERARFGRSLHFCCKDLRNYA